ncbi:MAG: outer membrane lipoprotein-sorting protein [Acidobacteria bacterium]|nr:outer membrane lipoprotein-sorting protein [Acidobacteriota bacterium]
MNRLLAALLLAAPLAAQDARTIVDESQKRSRADSQRYEGTLEVIDSKRKVTTKKWIYERLGSAGESKAVLRFTAPAEVKGVALLIHNHPDRASDQWMWTPAVQRERRIAFQDRRTRFFGTDFTFEDLEERDVDRSSYKLLGEETLMGALCWKIESTPKAEAKSQYSRVTFWIRKDNYVLTQAECFGREKTDKLVRRIRYSDIEKVQGIFTPRMFEVRDEERESTTVMKVERLQYNTSMPAERFTLQALRRDQ